MLDKEADLHLVDLICSIKTSNALPTSSFKVVAIDIMDACSIGGVFTHFPGLGDASILRHLLLYLGGKQTHGYYIAPGLAVAVRPFCINCAGACSQGSAFGQEGL